MSQRIISESVEITPDSKFRNAFNNSYSQMFVLTFHQFSESNIDQTENPIGKIPLLFHKTKPEIQIAKWSGLDNKILLKSKGKSNLEFQAKIKPQPSRFRRPTPLTVTIPENDCFSMIGEGITKQVAIIPVDTASYSRWQKFKVPIKIENIDDSSSRQSMGNITINFQTDVLAALKPDILVVKEWIYHIYKSNPYICGVFFLIFIDIITCAALYAFFAKVYRFTEMSLDDPSIRQEGFNVHRHKIYDSNGQLVLRLRQRWWFASLKQVGKNPKSNIEKATLLPLSSKKSGKPEEEGINLLGNKRFIWAPKRYQIILQANGKASKFKIDCNDTIKTWYKRFKIFLALLIVPTFILAVGWVCVFWHWYPRLTVLLLVVYLILFAVLVIYALKRKGQNKGEYKWIILRRLSSILGISDGFISIVEAIFSLFI